MTKQGDESFIGSCLRKLDERAFYNDYRRTFSIVPADTDDLRRRVFRLRYQVYGVENHFLDPLKYPDELERDAFDDRAIHWLLLHRKTGEAAGTVRVCLPHDERPLVSFELQKTCDHPLLQIENRVLGMSEISRFCMAPQFRRRLLDGHLLPSYYDQEEGGRFEDGRSLFRRRIPYAPLGLLQAAFETSISHGIHNCMMTIESSQLQSFQLLGLNGRIMGPSLPVQGEQQPVLLNIRTVLESMARADLACWEIVTDRGRLQQQVDQLYRKSLIESQGAGA
jgi:N-acyl amino acid synthase of PEP-CTERM/exosortase system